MPVDTIARAVRSNSPSLMPQPNLYQELQPIGGVGAIAAMLAREANAVDVQAKTDARVTPRTMHASLRGTARRARRWQIIITLTREGSDRIGRRAEVSEAARRRARQPCHSRVKVCYSAARADRRDHPIQGRPCVLVRVLPAQD